jgi:hypothetical protein
MVIPAGLHEACPAPRTGSRRVPGLPAIVALLAFVAVMGGCQRQRPIAPELLEIRCQLNKAEHARAMFGKAEITFVCIPKSLADSPGLLRCDLESRPMICEDAGSLSFTRGPDGKLYAGYGPKAFREDPSTAYGGSRLVVNFHAWPPRRATFDEVETDWRFLLPEAKRLLPAGFTFVKGALCDRNATVLGSGTCNLEARSASLYWHVSVSILAERGTPVSAAEYREEMAFWLGYLDRMVVDPKK